MRRMAWTFAFLLVTGVACSGDHDESGKADGGQSVGVGFENAFLATADASGYRITQSIGQMISVPALGLDNDAPLDEENPTVVGEVAPEASHLRVDLSTVFRPLLGDDTASVAFEIWTGPDRMVIDTREYSAITEHNPRASLGPLEPGVSFVDLEAVRDRSPDLIAALVGQGLADPRELADRLPEAIGGAKRAGNTFTGTASYADLLEAMGSDPDVVARSAAAGMALNADVDPDVLTAFYVEYFAGIEANISIDIGTDGTVRALWFDANFSGIFTAIVDHRDELGLDIPAADLEDVRDAFDEAEWTVEVLTRFEVPDDLQVEAAPSTTDDRTEEWLASFRDGGF
jgi:hypothetical protein